MAGDTIASVQYAEACRAHDHSELDPSVEGVSPVDVSGRVERGTPMILKQYYLGCLAHASYLIADRCSTEAAVIDPQRDVDHYLADAEQLGCRIGHVFLTHLHADFIAGHLELRDRVGATIHLGARATAEYAFTPMADGDRLTLGAVRLEVLETPGHSPESISILVYDPEHGGDSPYAVLTGDTLFIGDVGRPDLGGSMGWPAEALASMLFDSLHEKLVPLPDATLVYPAHGAGSLCGKSLSTDTVSTIGVQRQYNYALQPMSRPRFIEMVTTDQPDAQAYFSYDAVLNARERPTLDETLEHELQPLSLDQLRELVDGGAQLLDTRDAEEFAAGHVRGALNVGLGGSFATWCGTILDVERPVVVIAEPGRETEAATRLGRIGFDTVVGHLAGGMQQLGEAPDLIERIERITAESVAEQLVSPAPPLLIDVRTAREWDEAHIDGAVNAPLARLMDRVEEIPSDRSLRGRRRWRTSSAAWVRGRRPSWRLGGSGGESVLGSEIRQLGELQLEVEGLHHVGGRRDDSRCAHDGGDGGQDALDLVLCDAALAGGAQVEHVGRRRCIDRNQRGDADEHQRLLVKAGRLQRVFSHLRQQIQDWRVVGLGCHERLLLTDGSPILRGAAAAVIT